MVRRDDGGGGLRPALKRGGEALHVDAVGRDADVGEQGAGGVDHGEGAADIGLINRGAAQHGAEQGAELVGFEAAVQHVDVLLLA